MLKSTYLKHLKIARIALKNHRGAQEALQLTGARKESLSGFLKQVNVFYTNALEMPNVIAAMSKYNITEEKLKQGRDLMEETRKNTMSS
ncbi:MAG: hypothetical protein AAF600_19235 [Bacteroidota bacterium]